MNKNDLIRRGDVLKIIDGKSEFWAFRGFANAVDWLMSEVNAIPAVQQPMSAAEYERERGRFFRWCNNQHKCEWCHWKTECYPPWHDLSPEERVKFILKWAQGHPEGSEE